MNKMVFPIMMVLALGLSCAGNQNGSMQLMEGARAPDFTAQDQGGSSVTLSELLARGPVVVSLLRGFS